MTTLSNTVANGFIYSYQDFVGKVKTLAEKLSEEQFWQKPYPYGNSFGNLVLHITGNLSYYIGTQIANTGYIRKREIEFANIPGRRKDEVLRSLDDAVNLVIETLNTETNQTFAHPYAAIGIEHNINDRFSIYLRCAVHFHHHVGQMIYLVKALSDTDETSIQ